MGRRNWRSFCFPRSSMKYLAVLGLLVLLPARAETPGTETGDVMPLPTYPAGPWHDDEQGIVYLSLTFNQWGLLVDCHVDHATALPDLAQAAADFVKNTWHSRTLAGTTRIVPIEFRTFLPGTSQPGTAPTGLAAPSAPTAPPEYVLAVGRRLLNEAPAVLDNLAGRGPGIVVTAPDWHSYYDLTTAPKPAFPESAKKRHEQGSILYSVTFGPGGRVSECHVVRSSASAYLDAYGSAFIRDNWIFPSLRNLTVELPLSFVLDGTSQKTPESFPAPPYYTSDSAAGTLTLVVTFGTDGWVSQCVVSRSTGNTALDNRTMEWVKTHWHDIAYAGQTIQAPFEFRPAVAPAYAH
jgi:TonB family protein